MTPYDFENQQGTSSVSTETSLSERADTYVRANPVPAILTAVAIGFGLGLMARLLEPDRRREPIRDCLDESSDWLGSLFNPVAKKTRRAYTTSSKAVRGVVEDAGDRIRDIDADDYIDPVVKWWKRLWS